MVPRCPSETTHYRINPFLYAVFVVNIYSRKSSTTTTSVASTTPTEAEPTTTTASTVADTLSRELMIFALLCLSVGFGPGQLAQITFYTDTNCTTVGGGPAGQHMTIRTLGHGLPLSLSRSGSQLIPCLCTPRRFDCQPNYSPVQNVPGM